MLPRRPALSYAAAAAGPPPAAPGRAAPGSRSAPAEGAAPARAGGPTEPTAEDGDLVLFLLGVFAVTALVAVGALWAAAVIDTWWALVGMMVVHLTMSAIVFVAVSFVLSGHRPTLRRHGDRG